MSTECQLTEENECERYVSITKNLLLPVPLISNSYITYVRKDAIKYIAQMTVHVAKYNASPELYSRVAEPARAAVILLDAASAVAKLAAIPMVG